MLLTIDEKHKNDLQFLRSLSPEVLGEFCRISLEFLRRGSNKKVFGSAAQKLGVPVDTVTHVVEGLAHLLTETSRYMLSEADFIASLLVLNLPDTVNQQLKELYLAHGKEIRGLLCELYPHLDHYVNLDWRFDVQLASRSLRGQTADPYFILNLETTSSQSRLLQVDPHHLKHITSELEAALQEIRANDVRRIMRNIK